MTRALLLKMNLLKCVRTASVCSLLFLSLLPTGCFSGAQKGSALQTPGVASPAERSVSVQIFTEQDGEDTHFYVQNDELCEITMTFDLKTQNLQAECGVPHTLTFPAQKKSLAFTLSPINPDLPWDFSYTNYFKLGSQTAVHDDNVVYELPYAPGSKFHVTQGYNGKFSHQGSNLYAIDWKMPEGTPVYAARGGLVVKIKDDSDRGGAGMEYDHFNNYVLIRHDDGTLGHYCHLKKDGVVVRPGQRVATGQLIAHSGNTGFSSGPHLHFCVFKTLNGRQRVSIPVKFETATDRAITLAEGHSYRARGVAVITAQAPAEPAGSTAGQGSAGQ